MLTNLTDTKLVKQSRYANKSYWYAVSKDVLACLQVGYAILTNPSNPWCKHIVDLYVLCLLANTYIVCISKVCKQVSNLLICKRVRRVSMFLTCPYITCF